MARSGRSRSNKPAGRQWRKADLHLHTPASSDYQEPNISYLDILRQAKARELDLIAFTDHNSIAGYAAMKRELAELELLERLGRLKPDEKRRLEEYHQILNDILVLPGFEFTATFGFHILGIFSPDTPVTYLQHLLLTLNVPLDKLDEGSSTVGATSDVLTAYRIINQGGGIVIAAHANSGNGVVMRGIDFGGQTRIAYTQDPNLHCLEVTDLEKRSRHATRRFFDGSKPEYPRPMRCIQGSDAHRLVKEAPGARDLGIGDRVTEILLSEVSFDGLCNVLRNNDFSLTRPYRGPATPLDFVQLAREEGPSIVQSFHKSMAERGGFLNRILEDICAMSNTNGGTVYIGLSEDSKEKISGIRDPRSSSRDLKAHISKRITPDPDVTVDTLVSQGKNVIRVTVPPGREIPFAIDDNRFYVRDENETTLAVRDEIVRLVERRLRSGQVAHQISELAEDSERTSSQEPISLGLPETMEQVAKEKSQPPRTGVEIVASTERDGTIYHTVRDLRNGNLIQNVTRSSARKLWHYAITKAEAGRTHRQDLEWHGNLAIVRERRRDKHVWYDLAMKDKLGVHYYYGVTDSGLNDEWMELVEKYTG